MSDRINIWEIEFGREASLFRARSLGDIEIREGTRALNHPRAGFSARGYTRKLSFFTNIYCIVGFTDSYNNLNQRYFCYCSLFDAFYLHIQLNVFIEFNVKSVKILNTV